MGSTDAIGATPTHSRRAVTVAYVVSVFVSAMDTHIVNVALPTLSRQFHAPISTVQWTVVGYVLGLAMFIPASGWFADRFGTKRIFLAALALFTVSSALSGSAQNIGELITFRVAQGIGGGTLLPTGTAMLYRAYPPEDRARMARLVIMPIIIAPAVAPVVGGLLVEKLSWRWAFFVNVPIGIVGLIIGATKLADYRGTVQSKFDLSGFALSGLGLTSILYGISEGPLIGWGSPQVVASAAAGLVLLGVFTRLELQKSSPILNLSLLQDRLFRASTVVTGWNTAAFLGMLYLAPIFLQEARGQSPLSSGLTTFVEAIGVVCGSQTIARFYSRVGPRRMITAGASSLAAFSFMFLWVGPTTNPWFIRGILFAAGFCNSASLISVQASAFTNISQENTAHASAIYSSFRQSSVAISVAILSAIVGAFPSQRLLAFHAAFAAAGAMALCGALSAYALVRDSDARSTMRSGRSDRDAGVGTVSLEAVATGDG